MCIANLKGSAPLPGARILIGNVTTGDGVSLIGMGVEAVGVLLTGYGFLKTWREFGDEGLIRDARPLLAASAAARRAAQAADSLFRRLTRRPRNVVVGAGAAHLTVTGSVHARGVVGFRPLDPKLRTRDAIVELDRRVRDVIDRLGTEAGRREDADNEVRAYAENIDKRLDELRGELDSQGKRIAVGGLRVAFSGLALVFVGLGLQALSVVLN